MATSTSIYEPAEDSFLLSNAIKKYCKISKIKNVLEIGCGSGFNLNTLKKLKVKKILGCDVNPSAIKHCKKLGFNCVKSDLFNNINEKFDLIIFNPPYLPEDKNEPKESRLATTGGKYGSSIINKFLKNAKKHLNKNGKILLLTSSLTKNINWQNFKKKKLLSKKLFFEELCVWELVI